MEKMLTVLHDAVWLYLTSRQGLAQPHGKEHSYW